MKSCKTLQTLLARVAAGATGLFLALPVVGQQFPTKAIRMVLPFARGRRVGSRRKDVGFRGGDGARPPGWWRYAIRLLFCAAGSTGFLFALPSVAQQFPAKAIRIVIPLAPGGPTDLLSRVVGQKMTEAWGQQVIVESRPGANGAVACELVARSTPDGYTLVMGTSGTHGINASLFTKLAYDPVKDFAPIARVGYAPYYLVSHPSLPVRNVKDLIALANARPGQIAWAAGGSVSQLAADLFKSMAKINVIIVPYKGNGPAVAATIAGETSLIFGGIAQANPQVKAGRLRGLAVSGATRSSALPDVPTVAEAGVPGYESGSWYGLFAPAGTPKPIVDRLNAELIRILALPDVKERLASEAFDLPADTPEAFAAVVRNEVTKWAKVVKETGAKVE